MARRRRAILSGGGVAVGIVLAGYGCAAFSDSECTTLAVCPDQQPPPPPDDGSMPPADATSSTDGYKPPIDAPIDSLVIPDGPLPDGTCNMGIEDCTNGKDDNCDGLIDCADPVCTGAGYSCVNVPSGWQGPFAWWEASSGPAPSCSGGFAGAAADSMSGLSAPPATCAACACAGATGQSCTASVTVYPASGCGSACTTVTVSDTGCTDYGACGTTTQSGTYTAATTSGGGCVASGGAPTLPAVSWSKVSRTCAYSTAKGAGCSAGSCYAGTTSPFGAKSCISQTGDVMCPGGGFSTKHLYYTGVSDARSCTACGCGGATGGTCNNLVQYWASTGCSSFPVTGGIPVSVCADTYTSLAVGGSVKGHFSIASAGTCPTNGGAPQGSAAANGPVTVCCP